MNQIQLIALDMDGTLLDDDQKVSAENIKAIRQALDAGVLVCFATGRGIQSVLPYVEEIGLDTPMVLVNGGEVWQHKRQLWVRHTLQLDEVIEMHRLATAYDIWFWAYTVNGVIYKDDWQATVADDKTEWIKFGYYTEDVEKLAEIRQTLTAAGKYEITNSHPHNLEINPIGVNKATGLQEVCRRLGLEMSQVAAVGDSLNDLAMIQEAGFGVAMGNAQEEIKAAAQWVTASNMEHGVARMIEKILKG